MKKTTTQFAAELLEKHQLTLVGEYSGAHSTITFLCSKDHKNTGIATNVLQRGYKCKQCLHGHTVVPKITWDTQQLDTLQALLSRGVSIQDIAKQLNTTTSAVNNAIYNNNIDNTLYLQRAEQLNNKLLDVLQAQSRTLLNKVTTTSDYALISCPLGHKTSQLVSNIVYKGTNCPNCFNTRPSGGETQVLELIKENYSGWVVQGDRHILQGQELDIVLPDLGLAIEFNGAFWHSDAKVDKYYHVNKTNKVEDFGYQLLHVHEHYWNTKQPLVKSKLLSYLISQPRTGARHTQLIQVPWAQAKEFLERNHIQGSGSPTKHNYGLTHHGALVALATFQVPRFTNEQDMELVRYATSTPVQGGLSKLITYAKKQLKWNSLVSYALRDWSTGAAYKATGFKLVGATEPNYTYYKRGQAPITRYKAQKHLLAQFLEVFDPQLSEAENMRINGWHRVYDSGSLVFTLS